MSKGLGMNARALFSASITAAVLAGFLTVSQTATQAAPTGRPTYIYGIDDNNIIWEVDPLAKTIVKVNDTNLAGNAISNSMAYDTDRDQFFFMYSGSTAKYQNKLVFWDRANTGINSLDDVTTLSSIGATNANTPANASYWKDSFWFFKGGSSRVLVRVQMTYVDGKPQAGTPVEYTVPALPTGSYNFGDIAINAAGKLFGATSNGVLFSIDLNTVATNPNAAFTFIRSGLPSLQLSFNPDYTVLFGHSYETGAWSEIDQGTGTQTDLGFATKLGTTNKGFRDLGGASTTKAGTVCVLAPPGTSQDQTAHIGEAVPLPLKVYLGTTDGLPTPDAEVIFRITSGGGNLNSAQEATVITDADGVATAPAWFLGTTVGENTVQVDNVGTVCDFTFRANAILGPTPPPNPDPGPDPTPGPGPGPDPIPQVPVKPLDLPTSVKTDAVTTITKLPIETNAGQYARVRATCTPLLRSAARADVSGSCRAYIANGRLKVKVVGSQPVAVRVRFAAPAVVGYTRYEKVKVIRSS